MSNPQTPSELVGILRQQGFAVVIFSPTELRGAPADRVEDRLIELGWEVIDCLGTEPDEDLSGGEGEPS